MMPTFHGAISSGPNQSYGELVDMSAGYLRERGAPPSSGSCDILAILVKLHNSVVLVFLNDCLYRDGHMRYGAISSTLLRAEMMFASGMKE
jgi:hypothetical protein